MLSKYVNAVGNSATGFIFVSKHLMKENVIRHIFIGYLLGGFK
jgi:hypothetical protein